MASFLENVGKKVWSNVKTSVAAGIQSAITDSAFTMNTINTLKKTSGKTTVTEQSVHLKNSELEGQDLYNKYATNTRSDVVDTEGQEMLRFVVPDWGYADFIHERDVWKKSLTTPVGTPGWFYFKIFFNFDTQYGLLGGLLNDADFRQATNSAAKYLWTSGGLYTQENLTDRITALHKFASILSFINTSAPWFFESVKNLNSAGKPYINDFSKEKSIEIGCAKDAVDMRLSTLLDLYRFACYDDINCKEIIPDNLRKFDMSVIIFETPIKYLHTSMNSKTYGSFKYKTLNPQRGYDKVMSFKMYTFVNCEIDPECLGNMTPGDINNQVPFQMGGGTIKINYDRVYTHTMNEFHEMLFGSDGFYYNASSLYQYGTLTSGNDGNEQITRYAAMAKQIENSEQEIDRSNYTQFKELVDASEALCGHSLLSLGGNTLGNMSLGNIAGAGTETGIDHTREVSGVSTPQGSVDYIPSNYYAYKLKRLANIKTAEQFYTEEGANYICKILHSTINSRNSKLGMIEGADEYNYPTDYYYEKLKQIHNGTDSIKGTFLPGYDTAVDSQYFLSKLKRLHNGGTMTSTSGTLNYSGIRMQDNVQNNPVLGTSPKLDQYNTHIYTDRT